MSVSRIGFMAVSAVGGYIAGRLVPLPLGLPEETFTFLFGPLAGVSGYVFGQWLGSSKKLRAILGAVVSLALTPIMLIFYLWVLNSSLPPLLAIVGLYVTFAAMVFHFCCGMALASVALFTARLK